jgi:hypothetical protein
MKEDLGNLKRHLSRDRRDPCRSGSSKRAAFHHSTKLLDLRILFLRGDGLPLCFIYLDSWVARIISADYRRSCLVGLLHVR